MSDLNGLTVPIEAPTRLDESKLKLHFSEKAIAELNEIKSHYPNDKAAILPGLWIAQREYNGFLSPEAIAEVAHRLHRSTAEVEGVATFYSMYNSRHKPGKHKLEVCTCLSCHANGAYRLLDYIEKKLGIVPGETTDDGLFTLEEVECLNACDRAVVMQVGDQYHGPVTDTLFDEIIAKLKARSDSTVVQMADELVKVHLPANRS